jgi:5-(carboxyamino)imidazole ribonucleotide synthase
MEKRYYKDLKVGVLGGGQLGRMLIQAAVDYNVWIECLDPSAEAPCRHYAHGFTQGSLTDYDTVYAFGKDKDLLTIEIENVNTEALEALQAEGKKVYPDPKTIRMIQDKRLQKAYYQEHEIPTSPFILIEGKEDLRNAQDRLPGVFKLAKAGYDGRGVQVLKEATAIEDAFDAPGLLEDFVDFEKEIAVIAARNPSGEIVTFPVVEMSFHPTANLVEFLFSPAEVTEAQEHRARKIANDLVEKLDFVGVLAIEMFVSRSGEILVNEIAPRPHNSGHHTIRANVTSQYEQHLRAILDLPLGATDILRPAAMVNMLGADGYKGPAIYEGLEQAMALGSVFPHIYGKAETKPFRKMGHVTLMANELDALKEKAMRVKEMIIVKSE